MDEANCLEEQPADIVARVLKTRKPCLLSARKGERGVLLPFDANVDRLVRSHGQVITARVRDLEKSSEMPMYCMQVGMSGERDAITFIDDDDDPVLALVGVKRYQKWAGAAAGSSATRKAKPAAAVSRTSRGSPPGRRRRPKRG